APCAGRAREESARIRRILGGAAVRGYWRTAPAAGIGSPVLRFTQYGRWRCSEQNGQGQHEHGQHEADPHHDLEDEFVEIAHCCPLRSTPDGTPAWLTNG